MASPPVLGRARDQFRTTGTRARSIVARHRVAASVVCGALALGVLTATVLPSMAAADVTQSYSSASDGAASSASDASASTPAKKKWKRPKPASATHKARNVPAFPPDRKHHGKRVVYDKALMTVWLIDKHDEVVARYPVVGRFDRPLAGVYKIFSKSEHSSNPFSKVTFNHMVRFAWGPDTKSAIGLHSIPRYYDGTRMHSVKQLGLAIARGGCVRLSDKAAAAVYRFAHVGDRVVVLPSP